MEFAKAYHKIPHLRKNGRGTDVEELSNMLGFPLIFVQQLKPATSNLACRWSLARPTIKSHNEEKLKKLTKILGFPFNICTTSEASNFKFNIIIIIIIIIIIFTRYSIPRKDKLCYAKKN